jgi:4-diphosphocytidyl-2-C-methyl-D-erythritol kinase
MRLSACAKVNLSLEVLGRRPDGFHDVVSVTQLVSLADEVEVSSADAFSIQMQPPLVDQADDLTAQAADLLAAKTAHRKLGQVRIGKRIPLAAGLGGGSSDAAAALRLLDRLWETRLGPRRLAEIAAVLGSDVPLFLGEGASLVQGRGEIVRPLTPAPPFWLLLICPGGAPAQKTRAMYSALSPAELGTGTTTLALADRIAEGAPVVGARLVNSFDAAANRVYPEFSSLRERLEGSIERPVHLTGAGPTLFSTFETAADAREASRRISSLCLVTFVVRSIGRRPSIRVIRAPGAPFARSTVGRIAAST